MAVEEFNGAEHCGTGVMQKIGEAALRLPGKALLGLAVVSTFVAGCRSGESAGVYPAPSGAKIVECNTGERDFPIKSGQEMHLHPSDGSGRGVDFRQRGNQIFKDGEPVFKGLALGAAVETSFNDGGVDGVVRRIENEGVVSAGC